jgi:hypothetical protein
MSSEGRSRAVLDEVEAPRSSPTLLDPQAPKPAWLLEELRFAWREAQGEAAEAYDHWGRIPGREAYTLYRASQDRAETAQDVQGHSRPAPEQRSRLDRIDLTSG